MSRLPRRRAHPGRLVLAERAAQPDDAASGELDAVLLAEHAPPSAGGTGLRNRVSVAIPRAPAAY
jgi:hypothetical protein